MVRPSLCWCLGVVFGRREDWLALIAAIDGVWCGWLRAGSRGRGGGSAFWVRGATGVAVRWTGFWSKPYIFISDDSTDNKII